MTEHEISQWADIVRQALQYYFDQRCYGQPRAVPGAPLKPLVQKFAADRGLTYPPQDFQNKKFSDFLQALPAAVLTQRRLGQDLLVAPSGRFDLFETSADAPDTPAITFRADVFRAFTRIPAEPNRKFWYSKSNKTFVEGASDIEDDSLVPVDAETLDTAIAARRQFIEQLRLGEDAACALLSSLDSPIDALGRFSVKVKELRLERQWHRFRTEGIHGKLQAWAAANGIAVDPDWMEKARHTPKDGVSSRETNAFLAGLMHLGPEDAKRVLVPLDIVLKVLRRD